MSKENEKKLGQENTSPEGQEGQDKDKDERVEGFAYCSTTKNQCLNDCLWPLPKAVLVDIN